MTIEEHLAWFYKQDSACNDFHEVLTSSGASGAPAPLQSNGGARPICNPQQASADIRSSQHMQKLPTQGTALHHGSLRIKAAMKPAGQISLARFHSLKA